MTIVLDTNVLVSGIFFGGIPEEVLTRWSEDRFQVYVTPSILEEYLRVIERTESKKVDGALKQHWKDMLPDVCHLVPDIQRPKRIARDAHDDKFVYCAITSGAKFLVTGDKDLLSLNDVFPFKILPPQDFMKILK
ncbi:MAG: putative toxin-antitoxin system toxin component, PIN family [Candidatus Omnitrophica bacterium]|nr:putative toxin-antitoxin system toxin component, PIN family [Candidatus Omnitrophota bacterium]